MKAKQLLAIAIFTYAFAGIFGGIFLMVGTYIKINGSATTAPFNGTVGQEFGVLVFVVSFIVTVLLYYYLTIIHKDW